MVKPTLFQSCGPSRCEKVNERLTCHLLEYHPSKSSHSSTVKLSRSIPKNLTSNQTECKEITQNFSNVSIQTSRHESHTDKVGHSYRSKIVSIPLRNIATQLTPPTNFYKQNLQDEVLKWFLNIPTVSPNSKRDFLRFKVVTNLIEKLTMLADHVDTECYLNEVIHEIEYCLDVLLMWSPNDKLQKQYLKKYLSRVLIDNIEILNEKWLRHPEEKWSIVTNCDLIHFPFEDETNIDIIKEVIGTWIDEKLIIGCGIERTMHKKFLTDVFAIRLIPMLIPKKYKKRIIKEEIKIILEEFSPMINMPKSGAMYKVNLKRLALDLADKLKALVENRKICVDKRHNFKNNHLKNVVGDEKLKLLEDDYSEELVNILKLTDAPQDTISQITEDLIDISDLRTEENDQQVVNSIQKLIQKSGEMSQVEALSLANSVVNNVKASFSKGLGQSRISTTTVVFLTSEQEVTHPFMPDQPLTSTPLLPEQKKEIEKLNSEERLYIEKVVTVVESWLDTTEMKFETNEEIFFKQTIAYDIAVDVKDLLKLSQMQGNMEEVSYENTMCYIIIKAIKKYGLIDGSVNQTTPQVVELKNRILVLETHKLLMPQHGNRQDLANMKAQINNSEHDQIPDALDIVKDNISVWMNEQPSDIFEDEDRSERNNQLHDVATKIQEQLEKEKSEEKVKEELAHWLKKIVKPNIEKYVNDLAEELKDKVMKLPQNETIRKAAQKRDRALAGEDTDIGLEQRDIKDEVMNFEQNKPMSKTNKEKGTDSNSERSELRDNFMGIARNEANNRTGNVEDMDIDIDSEQDELRDNVIDMSKNGDTNPDTQLKEFIEKYIEHNYEVKDPLVEGALGNILMQEFIKLSPILKKEAYEELNPKKFCRELEYIKEVTDWLKKNPFYSLLTSQSQRVEFINDLARIIADIEEKRVEGSPEMDYELILFYNILQYMRQLPIPRQYLPQLMVSANQLKKRIASLRLPRCCLLPSQDKAIQCENDVVKLLEDFVTRLHGEEIGNDQVMREAYVARLFKEIRKIMNAGVFTNSQFMYKLEAVPLPGKESVKRFSIEMGYAAEIADWLHNFPLIPLKTEEDHENRIRMISELAKKMVETDMKKAAHPNDSEIDADLDNYIAQWIDQLNLIPEKEVVVPVLISQLKKRMNNVQKSEGKSQSPLPDIFPDFSASRTHTPERESEDKVVDVGELMVKAIDNWCQDLPITAENENLTEATKENVAINLFKKVGQLYDHPHVAKNDPLFEELLADDIDVTLTNLSKQHSNIDDKKEELKASLLKDVMDAKIRIMKISAGDNYKNVLECTIDASFPDPVSHPPSHDPGYELYKRRMAMLWLLENYDHSTDYGALKYKMKLNQDVEKYADQAQKRNASPIEKNDIFNEIFSALYKQKPPSEHAIQEEIEIIKTTCEVEEWFKDLPLKEPFGFDDLLERDQIIGILSKKLFDIERSEHPKDVDEAMRKEIIKWMKKLPILSDEHKRLNVYAEKLICLLKASAEQRRHKRAENKYLKKRNTEMGDDGTNVITRKANTSQVAGPSGIKHAYHGKPAPPRQKPGDLIYTAIENWCKKLPLKADSAKEDRDTRDEAAVKLHQLLIELNGDPNNVNNEDIYEHHLNIGIQKILSELPNYGEEQRARNARKGWLISELSAIRPLIKDDLDREGYKQHLKSVLSSFVDETGKPNKITMNENAKNKILDDFVQYSYYKNNYVDQEVYKDKIKNTLEETLKYDNENSDLDPKLTSNRLISEMKKVRLPTESALADEVFEIRMKDEVSELLNDIPDSSQKEQVKWALAKKLSNIQRARGGDDEKVKTVIDKAMQKLGVDLSPEKINAFIDRFNNNGDGTARRPSPKRKGMWAWPPNQAVDQPGNRNVPMGPILVPRSPLNEGLSMNQMVPPLYNSNGPILSQPYQNRSLPHPSSTPYSQKSTPPPIAMPQYTNMTPPSTGPMSQTLGNEGPSFIPMPPPRERMNQSVPSQLYSNLPNSSEPYQNRSLPHPSSTPYSQKSTPPPIAMPQYTNMTPPSTGPMSQTLGNEGPSFIPMPPPRERMNQSVSSQLYSNLPNSSEPYQNRSLPHPSSTPYSQKSTSPPIAMPQYTNTTPPGTGPMSQPLGTAGPSFIPMPPPRERMNQSVPLQLYSNLPNSSEPYQNRSLPYSSNMPYSQVQGHPPTIKPQYPNFDHKTAMPQYPKSDRQTAMPHPNADHSAAISQYPKAAPPTAGPMPPLDPMGPSSVPRSPLSEPIRQIAPYSNDPDTSQALQNQSNMPVQPAMPQALRTPVATGNQDPSNVLPVPVEDARRTPGVVHGSAQTETNRRTLPTRNAGSATDKTASSCECTEDLKKPDCPGPCRVRQPEPEYCDECEGNNDCEYDDVPMCPCDLISRIFCYN